MTKNRKTKIIPEAEIIAEQIWRQYVATTELPPGIPPNPDEIYAHEGWRGWCDWLGLDPNEIDVEKVRKVFGGKARAH